MALAALVCAAGAQAAANPAGYPCPAAPAGWTASASNPTTFGPAQQPGQEHVMVQCNYTQDPKHAVSVVAEYALPADLNPINDFYYGCDASRKQAWTSSGRVFFVASGSGWSYAEFTDPGHQLPDAAVGPFESVTRTLLQRVNRNAHGCKINTRTPTVIPHLYLFGFEFYLSSGKLRAFGGIATQSKRNPLLPDASFTAVSSANATVLAKVQRVHAPNFVVHVVANGKQHQLVVRLNGGIDFLQKPPTQRLRFKLRVLRSTYAACPKASQGTLTITRSSLNNASNAPAAIRVHLCGALFARGTYRGTAEIVTG